MAHLSSLGLENFRTFRERATFDFAPLTILTGPNSSGKSSIFKALLLLQESARKGDLTQLNFKGGTHHLGSFETAKNQNSGEAEISFEIGLRGKEVEREWEEGGWRNHASFFPEIEQVNYRLSYRRVREEVLLAQFQIGVLKNSTKQKLLSAEFQSVEKEKSETAYWYKTKIHTGWFARNCGPIRSSWSFPDSPRTEKWPGLSQLVGQQMRYYIALRESENSLSEEEQREVDRIKREPELIRERICNEIEERWRNPRDRKPEDKEVVFSGQSIQGTDPLTLSGLISSACKSRSRRAFPMSGDGVEEKLFRSRVEAGLGRLSTLFVEPYLMKWTALLNDFFESEQMLHAGALRAEKRRIYTDESVQDGFIDTLEDAYKEEGRKDRVDRWVQEFGIGDYLKVDQVADTGYTIQIYEDGTARHLVDLGYGFTQLLPLILRAYQTLRVSYSPMKGRYTFLVEEPETNLHPNLQSKLADLFKDLSFPDDGQVVVETHSEYLIRRLQYLVAKNEARRKEARQKQNEAEQEKKKLESLPSYLASHRPEDALRKRIAIYYLGDDPEADDYIRRIEIMENGQLSQDFGSGFFDEGTNLMLGIHKYGSQN